MDESTFQFDPDAVASTSRRFPAGRRPSAPAVSTAGLGYLTRPGSFGEHAWDENGHY
jgi:hypothetical protein